MANTLHILLVLTHGVELLTYCVWVLVHDVAVHDVAVHDVAVHDVAVHDVAVHDVAVHNVAVHNVAVHDVAVRDVPVHGSGCDTHCGVACAVCCGSNTLAHNISTHCCCVITLYFCANSYCRHANTNCGHANTHRHRVNTHCFSANTHIVAVLTHKNPQIVNPSFVAGHSTLLPAHTGQT